MRNARVNRLVAAIAVLALPMTGLAALTEAPASADAVIGSVTSLGEHDIDANGTPSPAAFWNATFGPRYLFMTSVAGGARFLTAVDTSSGVYVGDWPLPQDVQPDSSLVADGDTVWVSTGFISKQTEVFKVGQTDPIADFSSADAVAVAGQRAYVFGADAGVPAVTVIDDDPSSATYLTPLETANPSALVGTTVAAASGDDLFVTDGTTVQALDADPASPSYLTVTSTATAPQNVDWLATDLAGDRLLAWQGDGAIDVYDMVNGQLVGDGTFGSAPAGCGGSLAALSPDGRLGYLTTCDVPDEVRVYDMTVPSHPQVAAIESFAGAGSMAIALSPDGHRLTTGGEYPKIATVTGYASTPTISGPDVPPPGETLRVDLGYWSPEPSWQWQRNGRPIPGTTDAATYRVTKADLGTILTVRAVANGVGSRSSAAVAAARPPRITATVSGQRRAGWYRGRATISFTCTPGSAPIVACPAP